MFQFRTETNDERVGSKETKIAFSETNQIIFFQFVSSLQSITSNKILETFKPSQMIALMDMPLHLSEQLKQLYEKKKATPLKNY